ncbi:thioesterase [Streptomyces pactum]|uniref:Thioesterase n=1 Tax=Streptomyces pactum TaxID=68249 RepID=A0ABS0NSR8_9ACTN|nr:alpha/beta fold hydrolase [Streptomyces pactum]MBH5338259.1 thioesterase [Streptomyces pactum]
MSDGQRNDLWVRRFHPVDDAGVRVVCLPHAGGSAPFFFPFSARLAAGGLDVLSVQYPGRQDRRDEPALDHLPDLAEQVFQALRGWADRPLVLLGHSMGAVIAYEVARQLERTAGDGPLGLIASGRRAPSRFREETVHTRDDAGFLAEIRQLSGTSASILDDEELVRMVLPALRADYKAVETHVPAPQPLLRCPIGVLTGESDPRVSLDEASAWREHTTGGFHFTSFTGGHFYLNDHQPAVCDAVAEYVEAFTKEAAAAG